MKSLIFTIILIISFVSHSQKLEIDKVTGKYTISGVSEVATMNKQEIFDAIYKYVVLNFSKLAFVNEYNILGFKNLNDADGNYLVNNALVQTKGDVYSIFMDVTKPTDLLPGTNFLHFSMLIEIKDGMFRYTFRNFVINNTHFELNSFVGKKNILENTEFYIGALIIRLDMACKSNGDWY